MKKTLLILLSVLLVVTSCYSALMVSAGAATYADKDYNKADVWTAYSVNFGNDKGTIGGEGITPNLTEVTDVTYNGGASALRYNAVLMGNLTAKLENLEADKYYTFSYKYQIPNADVLEGLYAGADGIVSPLRTGIYKEGATVVSGGEVTDAAYIVENPQLVTKATVNAKGNVYWAEESITFKAPAEAAYVGLTTRYGGVDAENYGVYYFDDFKLVEATAEAYAAANNEGADALYNYNASSAWKLYGQWVDKTTLDGTGGAVGTNGFTEITSGLSDALGDGVGLNTAQTGTMAATKLAGLVVGKEYEFTYKFMLPTTVGTTSGRKMFVTYLAKAGTTVTGSSTSVGATYDDATITVDGVATNGGNTYNDGTWHNVKIAFTATAEMVSTGVYVGAFHGGTHYGEGLSLDDFKLVDTADLVEEPGEDGNADPEADVDYNDLTKWKWYESSFFGKYSTIDNAGPAIGSSSWGSKIVTDVPASFTAASAINFNGGGSVFAAKLENLVAGKNYKFTFKYMIPTGTTAAGSRTLFEVYLAKHGATVSSGNAHAVTSTFNSDATFVIDGQTTNMDTTDTAGEWKDVTITFTATADMVSTGVYVAVQNGNHAGSGVTIGNFDLSVVKPVAAEDVNYDDTAAWKLYATNWLTSKSTVDGVNGEAAGSGWFPIKTSSDPALPNALGNGAGLAFGGTGMYAATKLQNLVAGTEYIFTFKMMVPSANTTTSRQMFNATLAKPGATVDGNGQVNNTYAATVLVDGAAVNSAKDAYVDSTWRTVTIRFTATEEMVTNGVFAGVSYGGQHGSADNSMVLDDFDLVVVPKYEEFDNNTVGTKDYNSASDWYVYSNSPGLDGLVTAPLGATVAGEGETLAAQGGMTEKYDVLSAEDTDGKALTASGLLKTYAKKLEGLEAGKTYTFTFKYKISHFNIVNANSGDLLKAGIYKAGAAVSTYNGFDDAYLVSNAYRHTTNVLSAEQSVWKEVKLTFTPTAEDIADGLYIAIKQTFQAGDVDIDDTATENIVSNTSAAATAAGGKYGTYYYDELRLAKALPETFVENKAAICNQMNLTGGPVAVNGLRIYNRFYNVWHDADIIEYGSIAIRSGRINNANELTLDAANATKGISYLALGEDSVNIVWTKDEASTTYTSYLSGIAPKFYGEDYTIRSYAKDVNGNVYYGEAFSLSIYDVVHAIKTANVNAADVAIADQFIAAAEAAGATTYEQWVKANKLDKVAGVGYEG